MYYYDHYVIDWDKVQSLDDLKRVIAAMEFSFEPDAPTLASIIDVVKRERKPGRI